ncbi:MAG: TIGR03936 family radical SAM-associated protein [Peptococcaceae bacterium]|nr:TIGR03936 family radical SAM-associated protein [Peptococcaceae bacterium]
MPRYRISYTKEGTARFISHLDMIRLFERAVRRAGLPVSMSRGFNPHPRLSFSPPLPVGVEGLKEYLDMDLDAGVSPARIVNSLNSAMPPGLGITGACRLDEKAPALMAEAERSLYIIRASREEMPELEALNKCLEGILALDEIPVTRRKKDGPPAFFNIRPGLLSLRAVEEGGRAAVEMELMTGSRINVRPEEVIALIKDRCGLLGGDAHLKITRVRVLGRGGKEMFDYCAGEVEGR